MSTNTNAGNKIGWGRKTMQWIRHSVCILYIELRTCRTHSYVHYFSAQQRLCSSSSLAWTYFGIIQIFCSLLLARPLLLLQIHSERQPMWTYIGNSCRQIPPSLLIGLTCFIYYHHYFTSHLFWFYCYRDHKKYVFIYFWSCSQWITHNSQCNNMFKTDTHAEWIWIPLCEPQLITPQTRIFIYWI